jgi:hypothetical protein
MGVIRTIAPNVPRDDAGPLTQVEKEDKAATIMDQRRKDNKDTMSNYYDHRKRRDPNVKKRKKKQQHWQRIWMKIGDFVLN